MSLVKRIKKLFLKTPFSWPLIAMHAIKRHEKARVKKGTNEYIQAQRVRPWFSDIKNEERRFLFELDEDSVLFDVGGYHGEYAAMISNKYNCNIYVFEPIPALYRIIKNKFSHNKKIHVYCTGLGGKTEKVEIALMDNASSVFVKNEEKEVIQIKAINEFIDENNITQIDLLKLNIEGGEYELLESLIASNRARICKNILVQFHDFIIPDARERMEAIQRELSKTHELTFSYEFVWENWQLKIKSE